MAGDPERADAGDEEMAEAGSGGSDGSSGSDSDFEELTISPEDTELLMKLEQQLQDNPSLYDSHVQVGCGHPWCCSSGAAASSQSRVSHLGRCARPFLSRLPCRACRMCAVHRGTAALQDGLTAARSAPGDACRLPSHRSPVVSGAARATGTHHLPPVSQQCGANDSALLGLPAQFLTRHAHAATVNHAARRFDWLSDEIEGLSEAEDVPRIEALMDEAVQDYLSVPLWVQYLE